MSNWLVPLTRIALLSPICVCVCVCVFLVLYLENMSVSSLKIMKSLQLLNIMIFFKNENPKGSTYMMVGEHRI
jgi:hypothetical protein